MLKSLNGKKVNPLLDEFDVSINFIRKSVGIVRDIVKMNFIKNIIWAHFANESQ